MKTPNHPAARLALVLGCCLALLAACAPPDSTMKEGAAAPAFRLDTLDGRQLGPQDLEGQVVLLDFWATWCGPCHAQAEILQPIYAEYKSQGLEILSIDVEETKDEVRRFVQDDPFPYPVLLDVDGQVSGQFAVLGLPTLVLIDREGKVALAYTGVLSAGELRRHIEKALG